jgi:hypothetical protein
LGAFRCGQGHPCATHCSPVRDALLEVKPIVDDALATVALLEQRGSLTDREQRQASALRSAPERSGALRRFQTTIEEACGDDRTR